MSYPSLKPLGFWTKNLMKRTQFFSLWSKTMISFVEGKSPIMNPYSIWLSGFFFPQGLLAAISQNYARKYSTSIDALEFKYTVLNDIYEDTAETDIDQLFQNDPKYDLHGQDGVILCGFFLDGGKWLKEKGFILDSPVRFTTLPHFLCQLVKVKKYSRKKFRIVNLFWLKIMNFFVAEQWPWTNSEGKCHIRVNTRRRWGRVC